MATSIVMPALELAQETGKLVAWRRSEGEAVVKGEVLLEVETDKAVVEIEAPADGVIAGVKASPGDVVAVGRTIAWLVQPGELPPAEEKIEPPARAFSSDPAPPAVATRAVGGNASRDATRISPKARRLARERGVDLSTLRGSGPEGEVLADDVLAAASRGGSASAVPSEPLGKVARLMAERTQASWTTVPHFFLTRTVDAGALVDARRRAAAETTYTDLLVALTARVLKKHPRLNASWVDGGVRLNRDVHIGLATAVDDGVVVTVIRDAGELSVSKIAAERLALSQAAKAGHARPSDLAGATFTISNLGMYGVDSFTAIIVPPQAAILAVGAIVDRVVAVNDLPAVRPMLTLTLSSDHRVVDGARAALFMDDLAAAIAAPGGSLS